MLLHNEAISASTLPWSVPALFADSHPLANKPRIFLSMRKYKIPCMTMAGFCLLCGCFGGTPARIDAPDWDVDAITDGCMAQCDLDGDGMITKAEAKENAPGLDYAFRQLDTNEDKKLSREEVFTRFDDYEKSKVGEMGLTCFVTYRGRPIVGGQLRLVPEAFMADYISEATGEVVDDSTGQAQVSLIEPGMYRLEVTSDAMKVPAKYNDETIIGIEAAPFTNPFETAGGPRFNLK